jgi:hypothetical protein
MLDNLFNEINLTKILLQFYYCYMRLHNPLTCVKCKISKGPIEQHMRLENNWKSYSELLGPQYGSINSENIYYELENNGQFSVYTDITSTIYTPKDHLAINWCCFCSSMKCDFLNTCGEVFCGDFMDRNTKCIKCFGPNLLLAPVCLVINCLTCSCCMFMMGEIHKSTNPICCCYYDNGSLYTSCDNCGYFCTCFECLSGSNLLE